MQIHSVQRDVEIAIQSHSDVSAAPFITHHRTMNGVARELGIVEGNLGGWVRQERVERGDR